MRTCCGYRPTRHGILYYANLGYPLLDQGARLTGPGWALSDRLDDGSAAPSDDHVEIMDAVPSPPAVDRGCCEAGLDNPGLGIGLRLRYDPSVLSTTALGRAFQPGVFALGIEPQTSIGTLQGKRGGGITFFWIG